MRAQFMDTLGDNPASKRGRRLDLQSTGRRVFLIKDRFELGSFNAALSDQSVKRVQVLAGALIGPVGFL